MTIPTETKEFAINMSNMRRWQAPVKRYVDELLAGKRDRLARISNMRWVASMVGDVSIASSPVAAFSMYRATTRAGQGGQTAPDV